MNTDKQPLKTLIVACIALTALAALLLFSGTSNYFEAYEYELELKEQRDLFDKQGAAAQKTIDSLKSEIVALKDQIAELESTLDEKEYELDLYVNPIQYDRTPAPLYDIKLSEELQQYTYDLCRYYDIEDHYELMLAMMWHESGFKADAVSRTNDYGLMQINICNHAYLEAKLGLVDIMDPENNIQGGVYIMSNLLRKHGDEHKALMAYNMGSGGASKYWDQGIYTSAYSTRVLTKVDKIKGIYKE